MVRWKMLVRRGLWLVAGIALLGLSGCGRHCPKDSVYREPAEWLATHALASERVAFPVAATACFGDMLSLPVSSQIDTFDLLSLLDHQSPDYIVAPDGIVWENLRGQPWFNERYAQVAEWRHVYPTVVNLTLFVSTPSPFDLGIDMPAPGEFVGGPTLLRGYRLSSLTATPDVPLYLTLLWDDVAGQDYAGLTTSVRVVAQDTDREWYLSESGFEPAGVIWRGDARLAQRYTITPPKDFPQGVYDLRIGLHEPSGRPLPALGSDGETREELLLATVIHPPDVDQAPIAMETATDYRLSDPEGVVKLSGYDAPARLRPGDTLRVALLWEAAGALPESYRVFVHLLAPDEALIAQADGIPVYGFYPTPDWQPGDFVRDEHVLTLPDELPRGDYALAVGLYHATSGVRLPVYDADGERLADDRALLYSLAVR